MRLHNDVTDIKNINLNDSITDFYSNELKEEIQEEINKFCGI